MTLDVHGAGGGGPRRGPGPLLLLVPLLVAVLAALSWDSLFGPRTDSHAPGVPAPAGVPAFVAADTGGWERVRLVPFHPDARRQAFEAAALRRSRGLADGEAWRLLLVRAEDGAPTELGTITVDDGRGTALAPLPTEGEGEDALGVLLRPPSGAVLPGEERQILLWGRRPRGTVRLFGIGGRVGAGASSIPLEPRELAREDLPRHLARLELGRPEDASDDGDE